MLQRAASMLRLERARLISAEPPVHHPLAAEGMPAAWSITPAEMMGSGAVISPQASIALAPGGEALYVRGDDSKYGEQVVSAPAAIHKNTDYVLKLPVRIEQGRMMVSVMSVNHRVSYASTIIEPLEGRSVEEQPLTVVELPFVSGKDDHVRVMLGNGASGPVRPVVQVGSARLFALGSASYIWTRYPRALIRGIQKLFLTALMLPFTIAGVILLIRARQYQILFILLAVPAYYLRVQSALHTEYRYVLAIHYFLFVMAATAIDWLSSRLGWAWRRGLRQFRSISTSH